MRCLRALNCGQQVCPASQGLERAKDIPVSPNRFGAKAQFPDFPSRLFPSHHKLFDPLSHPDTEKKRVKDPTRWYKDKGRPGPQGLGVRASPPPLLYSALQSCSQAWDPGAPSAPPRDPTMEMTAVFGKQTLGLQGGVLAGPRHVRGPHPTPPQRVTSHHPTWGEQTNRSRVAPGPGLATTGRPAGTCGYSSFPCLSLHRPH